MGKTEDILKKIENFVLELDPNFFIVNLQLHKSKKSKLTLLLDTDSGIRLEECEKVSRALGNYLDEKEIFDFSYELEVSSPGTNYSLVLPRQYTKNIGRNISLLYKTGEKIEGILTGFTDPDITIESEIKNPVTKKKEKASQIIDRNLLKEAKVNVLFK